jgi:ABC-2 type transport system ATP-binding protein
LDIISKKNIRQFLKKIPHDFQTTLILTSHDIDDIEEVCQRAIIINHGTKVYDDSLAQLKKEFKDDRYVCLVFNDVVEKNPLLKFGEVEAKSDGSFLVKVKSNNLVELLSFACTKDLIDTHIESVPLEEIISEIYKRK